MEMKININLKSRLNSFENIINIKKDTRQTTVKTMRRPRIMLGLSEALLADSYQSIRAINTQAEKNSSSRKTINFFMVNAGH